MKNSESGSLKDGLSMKESGSYTPESLGMGNRGGKKNQVPLGPAKHAAGKKPFTFA